ncbi:MAG TPA: hypothetical protein VKN99_01760 [Polyangia bacterium]|nr:hypothetical protein [Polyangia bacterium]
MSRLDEFELADLKLVYRALHAHVMEHTELMDSAFFLELQGLLQTRARADGVNLAEHAQWDAWLGQPTTPCDERMKGRRTLK